MRLFHLLSLPVSVFFEAEREWGNCRFILTLSLFFFFFNFTKRGIWRGWESRSRPLFLSYQLFSFFFCCCCLFRLLFPETEKAKKKKNEEPKAHLTFFFILFYCCIYTHYIRRNQNRKGSKRWTKMTESLQGRFQRRISSGDQALFSTRPFFFFSSFHNLL